MLLKDSRQAKVVKNYNKKKEIESIYIVNIKINT